MMRLMGLILMVIAVECFMTGLRPLLVDMIHRRYNRIIPAPPLPFFRLY